ncbi:hypothetical protein COCMIDRAFT_40949 [Bipolaris oryzae ATCC 44560]|uniref:Uncharacterized protein n=1 Tax=Bipolaris oryzae ATCC 44560 TaxID=930090 RepID=W6YT58_COCMI|nr:uncharacterized protein COCMIDRAFT_40949 [Bipolaris oryzae ATCC 44560]EUC40780.1 hypothetical protein COCMIDRAFT_40949 [Bipolaris oryzae ATCC 44560]
MVDSVFFRKGPSNLSPQHFLNRTVSIVEITSANQQVLAPDAPRTLQLTQIPGATLEVYVKKFDVCDGDKVDCREVDQNGKDCVYEMPPYCLAQVPDVRTNIKTYIHRERDRYLNLLLAESSSSQPMEGTESITQLTVKVALAYAEKRPESVVSMALDMWAYCRVIEREWTICGEDTLGLSKVKDPSSPWHKFIPITPIMDVQLDQIVIKDILDPLRQKLILSLEDLIKQHVPKNWFDCYLTMYILLNHIEWSCTHGNKFSKRYGMNRRYSDMRLAEAWFHTSKILLSRFHFWSNGSDPFKVNWKKPEEVKFAQLDKHQIRFMQQLQKIVKEKELHFKELRDRHYYEKDLYWTHQLFSPEWHPGLPHIVEETPA